MSRERATYERLICDGCGEAVLEASDLDRAARDHGWVVGDDADLCLLCRPDTPFPAETFPVK